MICMRRARAELTLTTALPRRSRTYGLTDAFTVEPVMVRTFICSVKMSMAPWPKPQITADTEPKKIVENGQ